MLNSNADLYIRKEVLGNDTEENKSFDFYVKKTIDYFKSSIDGRFVDGVDFPNIDTFIKKKEENNEFYLDLDISFTGLGKKIEYKFKIKNFTKKAIYFNSAIEEFADYIKILDTCIEIGKSNNYDCNDMCSEKAPTITCCDKNGEIFNKNKIEEKEEKKEYDTDESLLAYQTIKDAWVAAIVIANFMTYDFLNKKKKSLMQ